MVLIEFDKIKLPIVYTISGVTTLGGIIGMIVHGSYAISGGPEYIRNEFIGLWLSTILLFLSTQSFFILFENSRFPISKIRYSIVFKDHFIANCDDDPRDYAF